MFNITFMNLFITIVFVFLEWSTIFVSSESIFSVITYGAKGDGRTDDTLAFQKAWIDACGVQGSVIEVPAPFMFFVKPTIFSGVKCAGSVTFQVEGKIIAPQSFQAWGTTPTALLTFIEMKGITVQGKGTIDGQGSIWWDPSVPSNKPIALSIENSSNVVVTGILITNSPSRHLVLHGCVGVKIFGIRISSPGNSPNTDGIGLGSSQQVVIHDINVSSGDDCIAILGGCSDVQIYGATCGPSHGISIGSLGANGGKDEVSGINVHDSIISNSLNGVRIKTWQGGSGSVNQVNFTNIQVNEVKIPIIIDQFYCNGGKSKCGTGTSAVAISGITYTSIRGTYTNIPVSFKCSDSVPCKDITVSGFKCSDSVPCKDITVSGLGINPSGSPSTTTPICNNAFGRELSNNSPPVTCLQT